MADAIVTLGQFNPDTFFVPDQYEDLATHIYYAGNSLKYGTSNPAVNDDSVGVIQAVKGGYPMTYDGNPTPSLKGRPPYLIDNKWIAFNNNPQLPYGTDNFTDINPVYETWLVGMKLPGQTYEVWLPGGDNGSYFSQAQTEARVINNNYTLGFETFPPDYVRSLIRIRVNADNTADYWRDGVLMGTVTFTGADIDNVIKRNNGVGVITNNADWDFGALYVMNRGLTTLEASNLTNSLKLKWNIGSKPTEVLLTNIAISKSGSTWSATFQVENRRGVALKPVDQWNYKWRKQTDNFISQPVVATTPTCADSLAGGLPLKVEIQPVDINNRTWGSRYLSGVFTDTI